MFLTLDKFLVLGTENTEINPVFSVSPSATVGEVMKEFATKRVHRLYVKDGNTTKGVITLSDILGLI